MKRNYKVKSVKKNLSKSKNILVDNSSTIKVRISFHDGEFPRILKCSTFTMVVRSVT